MARPAPNPTKDPDIFTGWYSAAGGGTLYVWPHVLTGNVTMHAQWWDEAVRGPLTEYTITFDSQGGSTVDAITAPDETSVARPANPAKEGYTFNGWFSEAADGTEYASWPHDLSASVTMYAQWTSLVTYTVTFESHGGSMVGPITQNEGTKVSRPADPTRSGYIFNDWYSEPNGGTPYTWPYTLDGNITMHAQWTILYPVTFHSNGGSPAPEPQAVAAGGTVSVPTPMSKAPETPEGLFVGTINAFDGWYTDPACTLAYNFTTPVTGNLDLYAKWTTDSSPPSVDLSGYSGNTLEKALAYIAAQSPPPGTNYTIVLDGNYSMSSGYTINKANAIITLAGRAPSEVSLSSNGSLFSITAGKLILDNVTLSNFGVNVNGSASSFVMKAGAAITGVQGNGWGGGVFVGNGGAFTMEGGEIYGNTSNYNGSGSGGGGVYIMDSSFIMAGGEIYGNSADYMGGGVFVRGSFTMTGGKIYGNSGFKGGGVCMYGSFTMSGGEIYDNSVSGNDGGGVLVESGSFTMTGGEIYGNSTTGGRGGGVAVGASFNKTGGVIYGNNAAGNKANGVPLKNTATADTYGHAVYWSGYYRDTTLNVGDNISTSDTGSGWNQ
jgi:uncharacterized repeat protein (TIGR02543 family)